MTKRAIELLEKAADEFERVGNPFRDDWLIANKVTGDECIALSSSIAESIRFSLAAPPEARMVSALKRSGIDQSIITEVEAHLRFQRSLREFDERQKKEAKRNV